MNDNHPSLQVSSTQGQYPGVQKVSWVYGWLFLSVVSISIWIFFGISTCQGSGPGWSPDGTEIALTCSKGVDIGSADIYIAKTDDTQRWMNLTNNGGERYDSFLGWSPDGQQIVFDLDLQNLAVINANGSGEITHLTRDLPLRTGSAVWSPDGRLIAFSASSKDSNDYTPTMIYIVHADGSGPEELAGGSGYVSAPKWSPDGRSIAFLAFPSDESAQIIILHVEGGEKNILAEDLKDARDIVWSPNGQYLAFADMRGIELIGLDGSRKRILSLGGDNLEDWKKWGVFPYLIPAWSPDNQKIVVAYGGSRSAEISIVNINDGNETQLLQWRGEIRNIVWSPTGDRILFESVSDCSSEFCEGKTGIFLMSIDDNKIQPLRNVFPIFTLLLLLLPQLILVFGFRSPHQFVRRHTQQAAVLTIVNLIPVLALGLLAYYSGSSILLAFLICGWMFLQGILLLLAVVWGMRQVRRGDCWLMRIRKEGSELPQSSV